MHLNLHSREFRDEDRSDSRTASLHHLLLLSTSVSSSTSVYIFHPSTHSLLLPRMLSCRGVAAESFAGAAGTVSRAFIFGSGVLTLSNPLPPLLPFAKSVITMRPVRSTYRSLSQTEPWRSRARLPR